MLSRSSAYAIGFVFGIVSITGHLLAILFAAMISAARSDGPFGFAASAIATESAAVVFVTTGPSTLGGVLDFVAAPASETRLPCGVFEFPRFGRSAIPSADATTSDPAPTQ